MNSTHPLFTLLPCLLALSACITPGYIASPGDREIIATSDVRYEVETVRTGFDLVEETCMMTEDVVVRQFIEMEPYAYDRQENAIVIATGVLNLVGGIALIATDSSVEAGATTAVVGGIQSIGAGIHRGRAMSETRELQPWRQVVEYEDVSQVSVDMRTCQRAQLEEQMTPSSAPAPSTPSDAEASGPATEDAAISDSTEDGVDDANASDVPAIEPEGSDEDAHANDDGESLK